MNNQTKSKAFLKLILLHAKNAEKTKIFLAKDKRLTRDERQIVKGFLLIRDNHNEEARDLGESIKVQSDAFVEAMRLFLIGGALNNLGKYQDALLFFKKSNQLLPKSIDTHLNFVILNNIHFIYMNLHQIEKAREVLTLMRTFQSLPDSALKRLNRIQFGFEIATENFENATAFYISLVKEKEQYPDFDVVPLLNQFFRYGVVFNLLDVSEQAIEELKKHKKYMLTGISTHMKLLLGHLQYQKPVYFREEKIKGHEANLLELKFVRALDQNKISELEPIWKELQRINPHSFQDNFQYCGFTSVFSKCLELHRHKLNGVGVNAVKESNLSILDALEELIKSGNVLTKEQLFYYAYGRELESKDDLSRISRRIYQLKSLRGLDIQSIRGAYKLKKA